MDKYIFDESGCGQEPIGKTGMKRCNMYLVSFSSLSLLYK